MRNKRIKQWVGAILCLCMLVQNAPAVAFAAQGDDQCGHHSSHTADCGYVQAVAGVDCTHEHSEDCYKIVACKHTHGDECADPCTHECTVENGCITMEQSCQHSHGDCGYSEGTAEVPCGHVHGEDCGYVAASQGTACAHSCEGLCTLNEDGTYICLHAEHEVACGYSAPVESVACGHTEHTDCGYAPATEGTPCTHVCGVKVNNSASCYKLLCSHSDGGHDDACGYVAAVEGHECHFECSECAVAPVEEEPTDETTEAPTEAPAEESTEPAPVCYCAEACTAGMVNESCEVCGVDYTKCVGQDTAVIYAEDAVASVTIGETTTYYQTLNEAIDAVQNCTAADKAVVKMEQDVDLGSECLQIFSGVFTFDLNGKTLSSSKRQWGALCIDGGNVTITDSGEGGAITHSTYYGVTAWYGCTVTIEGGTITGYLVGVECKESAVIIDGGTIIGENEWGVQTNAGSTVTINGGTITGTQYDLYIWDSTVSLGLGEDGVGATFPGGLTMFDDNGYMEPTDLTLKDILGEGAAYWQDGKMLTNVTGTSINGDVTVKAVCDHANAAYPEITDTQHKLVCSCGYEVTEAHTTEKDENKATCTTKAACDLCGESYGGTDKTNHDETAEYVNGFCPNCDAYESAVLNDKGEYEISNAGNLYWFAEQVNGGNNTINAILMNDITINSGVLDAEGNLATDGSGLRQWVPIGHKNSNDDMYSFDGIFDGKGKTITGLYHNDSYAKYAGLFGYSTGIIQNLTLADTYINTTHSDGRAGSVAGLNGGTVRNCHNSGYVSGTNYIGGICAFNDGGTIQNCSNSGTISGSGNYVGGIVGCISGGVVEYCYNTGAISGSAYVGGVAGNAQRDAVVRSCYSVCTISSTNASWTGGVVGVGSSSSPNTVENCYFNSAFFNGDAVGYKGGTVTDCSGMTTAQFASGEVAYLLNGDQTNIVWKQTLNEQDYPSFEGGTVYYGNCGDVNYSNAPDAVKNHTFSDGICSACGGYDIPSLNADGFYEIHNANHLYWFAELVNGGDYDANAILMADIDLKNGVWTTITSTDLYYKTTSYSEAIYCGTFNGNGHVIKDFTVQGINGANCSVGLFGSTKGATIQNLGVDNMSFELNGATDVRAAAIVGQMLEGSLVENCYVVDSTLTPNSYIVGGIAACNYGGTIRNCFTRNVTISANARCGNLVSDCRGDINSSDRPGTVTNCWTDADRVVGTQNVAANITDCYANAEDAFASGEAAYKLGTAFGQTIGTNEYPVLNGQTVYQVAATGCTAQPYGYSNTDEPIAVAHQFTNGFCACGEYEEAKLVNGVYQIANAGQLYWFAELVNSGSNTINAILTDNITINTQVLDANGNLIADPSGLRQWVPIGHKNSNDDMYSFDGIFDGNGKTITGLYHNDSYARYAGLFGYSTGTIQNLTLVDTYINTTHSDGRAGSVAGLNEGTGIIHNCHNSGYVSGTKHTGGICGFNEYGTIQNCSNSGTVYAGTSTAGGIAGYVRGTVTHCSNTADVSSAGDWVGGISGTLDSALIEHCYNLGSVNGNSRVGGVSGNIQDNGTMENCYNCGTVTGSSKFGGIIGAIADSGSTLKNSYFNSDSFNGNAVGVEGGTITNCSGMTTAQFASGEVAWLLNGETDQGDLVWYQNIGLDAYPKFEGLVVSFSDEQYQNGNTVKVTISWTEMSFTYTAGEWNPETHTYDVGVWTADDKYGGQITVKNVGATNVPVSFTFQGTMGGVSGSFTEEKAALATGRSVTTTLTVSGSPNQSGFTDAQIGTVTVTLGRSDWAVGDKVTFYAKDGNAYPSTVGEVADSKAVLVSDNYNTVRKKGREVNDTYVLSLLTSVGARYPSTSEEAWTNVLSTQVQNVIPNKYGDEYAGTPVQGLHIRFKIDGVWTFDVTSAPSWWGGSTNRYLTIYYWYIWDVEFAS